LPVEQVVWLVLGMALDRDWSISRVVSHLSLPGETGREVVPSAPVEARARRGDEPMRWLFERCAQTWRTRAWTGIATGGSRSIASTGTSVRT
jgi:hypothetical protein